MSTPMMERTTHAPPVEVRRTTPIWMMLLAALLLLALGFAAGAVTMRLAEDEPLGLADESVVALIERNIAASNADDEAALAATYTPNARLFIFDGHVELARYEFADVIGREMSGTSDLATTSEVVQNGSLVSATYTEGSSEGVVVMELLNGKIDSQWIFIRTYK